MENYIVSARKYRPNTFATVVGQASITNTLKNAIKNDHIAQAFLFCGPRGVGKTTCARILAKTINCTNVTENYEACDKCPSCLSFNNSSSFNIYELDAASNNSVDDIRSLVDQVRIPPQDGKYKVYIIDEVHMLSASAFNAFLKTLEEPPAYAKFILATTEKHKIIPTILSRCQIFDFKRIKIEDIAHHLAYVADKENIEADKDALHIVAQKADGALRDALSIFDQLVSFAGQHLTYQAVIENLNVLDYDYYFKITDFLLQNDISGSLLLLNDVIEKGFDGQHFIIGLGEHLRNILVCKDVATVNLLEIGENLKERYKEQSAGCPVPFLLKSLDIINQSDLNYKISNNKRLSIEIMLMQLCSILNGQNQVESTKSQPIILPKQTPKPVIETIKPAGNKAETNTQPVNKNQPQKVSSANMSGMQFGSLSIKSITENNKKPLVESLVEEPSAVSESDEKYAMSQAKFDDLWAECLLIIKENSPSLYVTLSRNKAVLNGKNIDLKLDNKLQEDHLKSRKQEILDFIRIKTGIPFLQIETEVCINEIVNDMAYTDKEKFKKMVEKNPDLQKLKEELNLEIEF
jgi:DNA polymerase-3 subunit gamma/tau